MPIQSEANRYAAKAKGVVVRHVSRHQVVAIVEIVSPGNKGNQQSLSAFVRKAQGALAGGVHLLIVDLFPPTARDPEGMDERLPRGWRMAGWELIRTFAISLRGKEIHPGGCS